MHVAFALNPFNSTLGGHCIDLKTLHLFLGESLKDLHSVKLCHATASKTPSIALCHYVKPQCLHFCLVARSQSCTYRSFEALHQQTWLVPQRLQVLHVAFAWDPFNRTLRCHCIDLKRLHLIRGEALTALHFIKHRTWRMHQRDREFILPLRQTSVLRTFVL